MKVQGMLHNAIMPQDNRSPCLSCFSTSSSALARHSTNSTADDTVFSVLYDRVWYLATYAVKIATVFMVCRKSTSYPWQKAQVGRADRVDMYA